MREERCDRPAFRKLVENLPPIHCLTKELRTFPPPFLRFVHIVWGTYVSDVIVVKVAVFLLIFVAIEGANGYGCHTLPIRFLVKRERLERNRVICV